MKGVGKLAQLAVVIAIVFAIATVNPEFKQTIIDILETIFG